MSLALLAPKECGAPEAPEPERWNGALREETPVRQKVRGLTKDFGAGANAALEMLVAAASSKNEKNEKLGVILGVDNASFEARAGEIFAIMGLSGSGKSTSIRLLDRSVEPATGPILLDGRDLAKMTHCELIEPLGRTVAGITAAERREKTIAAH